MKVWDFLRDYLWRATGKDLSGPGKCFSRAIIRRIGNLQNNTLKSIDFIFEGFGIELASSELQVAISSFSRGPVDPIFCRRRTRTKTDYFLVR
jgi:hypothetical protein